MRSVALLLTAALLGCASEEPPPEAPPEIPPSKPACQVENDDWTLACGESSTWGRCLICVRNVGHIECFSAKACLKS
jgi:hypothetical protein